MNPVIEAQELSRWYGLVVGLNNVTFSLASGLIGLVGPNGAGKSTLIQIITGQLRPSSGRLTVFGEVPWNNPLLLGRLGYCPERESVPRDLHPMDWLQGLARMSGLEASSARSRSEQLLDTVRLPREAWGRRLAYHSKGMRQRVKLAQALLHEPELLVLDEPMNGLDPMGRQEMAQVLRDLAARGTCVVISSHILAELESLCRDYLILNWGRVLAYGDRLEIRTDLRDWAEEIQVRCSDPEKLARHLFDAGVLLGFQVDPATSTLHLRVRDPARFYPRWVELLLSSGVVVEAIRSESRSLQQIFERVTA